MLSFAVKRLSPILMVFAAASAFATPGPIIEDARLWLSRPGPGSLLMPAQPTFELALEDVSSAAAVAVDPERELAWFRSDERLASFDADGSKVMEFQLDRRGPSSILAVVASDGSLWLAEGSSLRGVGSGGQLLHDIALDGTAIALAVDIESNRLWVATSSTISAFEALTGVLDSEIPVVGLTGLTDLVPVPGTRTVWVAHAGGLDVLSAQAGPPWRIRFAEGVRFIEAASDGEVIGGFWATSGADILFLDPSTGAESWSRPAFGAQDPSPIIALAVDPVTLSAWVSDGRRLVEVTAAFRAVEHYDLGVPGGIHDLAILRPMREATPPTVEILAPARDETVTVRQPRIELRVTAGDFEPQPNSLWLRADGMALGVECHHRAELYFCYPVTDLPSGRIVLTAGIEDEDGRPSIPATVAFDVVEEPPVSPGRPGDDSEGGDPDSDVYTPIVSPRGVRPHTSFVAPDDVDFVDTSSGNVTVTLPLGQRYTVGPLLEYQFQLVGNSRVWEHRNACDLESWCANSPQPANFALTNPSANAGLGWEMHFGRLFAPTPPLGLAPQDRARWPNLDFTGRWMYVSPTGATHFLHPMLGRDNGTALAVVRYSKDGSFLRMVQTASTRIEIQFPDGLVSVFEKTSAASGDESLGTVFCGGGVSGCWRWRETRDLSGNSVSVTYSVNSFGKEVWRIADSTGRAHKMNFSRDAISRAGSDCPSNALDFCTASNDEWGDLRRVLSKVDLSAFAGQRAIYTLQYEHQRIKRCCPHDTHLLPAGTGSIRVPLLKQVSFPDVPGANDIRPYQITNHIPAGAAGDACDLSSGTVDRLTLPTGGAIDYDYQAWSFPTRCDYSDEIPSFVDRTYVAAGLRQRKLIRPSGVVESDWIYTSALRYLAPVDSGPSCRRADYRVTTVDGPVDGDTGNQRGWNRTKFFHALYEGPKDPQGPPSAPSLSKWQVQDHGLPFTKECDSLFPEEECTWDEAGLGLRFLSSRTFECTSSTATNGDPNRAGQGTCVRKRSQYVRYAAEWTGGGCTKDPPTSDGPECFKADAVRVAETTVFHDDIDIFGHPKWTDRRQSNYRGAGNFQLTTVTDNFAGLPGDRWEKTFWDVSDTSPLIDPVHGYIDPGSPSAYLPGRHEAWLLRTYSRKSTRGRHTTGTYVTDYQFDTAGRLECTRRRAAPGGQGGQDRTVKLVRGTDPAHDLGLVVEEIVAGGPLANLGTGVCAVGGTAAAGTRFRFGHEYRHHALSQSWPKRDCEDSCAQIYPNTYRADIDRNTGLPVATYNSADQRTAHAFDLYGRLTSSVPETSLQASALAVSYGYDGDDARVIETQTYGSQELTWQKSTFDEFGRLETERQRRPGGQISRRQRVYDGAGHLRQLSTWQNDSGFNPGFSTRYERHDIFGRPWRTYDPDGNQRNTTFNGVRIATHKVWFRHGAPDVPSGAEESRTTEIYDAQGQRIDVRVEQTGQAGFLHRTLTTYDAYGQVVRAERKKSDSGPVQVKTWGRDARGLLLSETLPEVTGAILYVPNALGSTTRKIQGPFDLRYQYDQAGRLIRIRDYPSGPKWKEWTWADSNVGSDYRKGKIVSASRWNRTVVQDEWIVTTDYEYRGALGQVSDRTTRIDAPSSGNPTFSESYDWDALGHLRSVAYPECVAGDCFDPGEPSLAASYTYDQGLMTRVDATLGGISGAYQYHPNWQIAHLDYGNGVDGVFAQGNAGMVQPQRIEYRRGNGTVLFDSGWFKYDPMRNVEQMRRSDADRSTFQYDAAGRLLYGRVVQNGADAWQEYHYDEFDSVSETRTDGGIWDPWDVDQSTNRLAGPGDTYDDAGNLVGVQTVGAGDQPRFELRYDPFMQSDFFEWCVLGSSASCQGSFGGYGRVWALHYGYDADDRRVITLDGDAVEVTYSLRDLDGQVLREYSGTVGATVEHVKDFVYGAEGLVATREDNGVVRYFHKDHLGSPRVITDAGQGVDDEQHFYPYGGQIRQGGTGFDEPTVKFTGHQRDPHGLTDYMMGRTCAHALFRFTSVDPGRDGWNLYSYAASNPIKYVDPTGHFADALVDLGFVAYDVGDIVVSLVAGEGVSGTQIAALGADLGSVFLPFVTGSGLAVRAAARSENVADGVSGVLRGSDEVTEGVPQGGTYLLRDPKTGEVARSGRTNNLKRRAGEHGRDPNTRHLDFETVYETDDRSQQRGLEQMLHDQYQPSMNRINPISPKNPRRQEYIDAANNFLNVGVR